MIGEKAMQSVLKLMPEAIPEVPRDGATQTGKGSGADGYDGQKNGANEFSRVFDDQVDQHNHAQSDAKPQGQQQEAGGNSGQSQRQTEAETPQSKVKSTEAESTVVTNKPVDDSKAQVDIQPKQIKPMVLWLM